MSMGETARARRRPTRLLGAAVALGLVLAACTSEPVDSEAPLVVASTTILGDVVSSVTGDEARTEVLMPIGADPHEVELSSAQGALLAEADLVVWVGEALESGMASAVEEAEAGGTTVLELLPLVDPLPAGGDAAEEEAGDEHEHGDLDPHFWFDPLRMATAVSALGDALDDVDPEGGWRERAAEYAAELEALDAEIVEILARVPPERRLLVTNHDTLRYFASRYGFEVVGTVIPGVSTLAEPSSGELAALAETIREKGVPAVFAETTNPTALAESLSAEVGADVAVVTLFTGSLGEPGSGAETYPDLLRTNAVRIADALS